jgi:polyhydroxyalkanoate synthesis regulator phasin
MNHNKTKVNAKRPPKPTPTKPKKSTFEIIMVPVEDLIPDEDNPNSMNETTFDALCEEIQEQGFDEPLLVRASPTQEGKYEIGSGHHRHKAGIVVGLKELPCVVKHWTDREKKMALTKRNVMRGDMDKTKLRKLYEDLVKGQDPAQVQREMGYTDRKKFEAIIDEAGKSLPTKQRKKLAEAKETIKTMDDLSSVLNRIFKESGSELDDGYLVFSFGGKNHHYFQIGQETEDKLQAIQAYCDENNVPYIEAMASILRQADVTNIPITSPKAKSAPKKRPAKRRPKK